jgi:hypothetical protein
VLSNSAWSESESGLIQVRVDAFRVNATGQSLDRETISTWIIPQTKHVPGSTQCYIAYGVMLDEEKAREQHKKSLKNAYYEGVKATEVHIKRNPEDEEHFKEVIKRSKKQLMSKLHSIRSYNYSVNCNEVSDNSSMEKYFDFGMLD